MKRRPSSAELIQDEAVKCRFCGEPLGAPAPSVLAEIAGAELTLKTLLLDLPGYAREYRAILRAPSGYFRRLGAAVTDPVDTLPRRGDGVHIPARSPTNGGQSPRPAAAVTGFGARPLEDSV